MISRIWQLLKNTAKKESPSRKSSSFEDKIDAYLKICASYHYPETKQDYIPDFTKPVLLEKSNIRIKYDYQNALRKLQKLDMDALRKGYDFLSDEYSRDLMIQVLAYNCFEEPRLRFPVFYSPALQMYNIVNSCIIDNEEIRLWYDIIKLKKRDLSKLGYNITLWQDAGGTMIDFIEEQYKYKNIIEASEGDIVIDGGGCYGDTALYFSEKTNGANVYSFEFLPENVDIFNKNMALNPKYKNSIQLIQKPISDVSGARLYGVPNGPGTSVLTERRPNAIEFESVSIDDFVEQNHIEKIDFIKLDIEGSEEAALKGAKKTIKKHKPKLAICAYHKENDLCILPQLIKSIVPEYKLYLDHYTINFTETVLFAKI